MGKRVLVVEDDDDNRNILTRLLSMDGYEVAEARDGSEAVAKAQSWQPDLILMDLALPRMDGWEATRRIKATPALAKVPIIAITAFAMRGDEEQARSAGCDDYLAKPARPLEIRQMVRKYLTP